MENNKPCSVKTAKILGLFMATALAITGCSNQHVHVDKNKDGYCDEDGKRMNSSSGGSHYYGGSSGGYYGGSSEGRSYMNTGTNGTGAPKGGIGSHSWGSGG